MTEPSQNTPPSPALNANGIVAADDGAQNAWSRAHALTPFPPLAEGREVTFTLTQADIIAAQGAAMNGGKRLPSYFPFVVAAVGMLVLAFLLRGFVNSAPRPAGRPSATPGTDAFLSNVVLPLLLPLLVIVLFYLFLISIMKKGGKKLLEQAGTQVVRLTPAYLYTVDPLNESKTRWPRITGIHDGKEHIFIQYVTNAFLPIPKRAFASAAEAKAFYDEAVALWKAGGGGG